MLEVVEKFISINGEGANAGSLAAFIRFKGCNLCCTYCDTRWANLPDAAFTPYTAEALLEWVTASQVRYVTLTGGEPLLQAELDALVALLLRHGCRVEIETNGSVALDRLASQALRPAFTMDYKLPDSGMEAQMRTENFALLQGQDSVKFVAGSVNDLLRAKEIIDRYGLIGRCNIFFSPVFGKIDPADMVAFMKTHRLNGVRLQLQLHKFIWEPNKKGV